MYATFLLAIQEYLSQMIHVKISAPARVSCIFSSEERHFKKYAYSLSCCEVEETNENTSHFCSWWRNGPEYDPILNCYLAFLNLNKRDTKC